MPLRPAAESLLLAGLLMLFICRAVLASAIVPPWQGPDEPTHFALAYGLTFPFDMQRPVQATVLESMKRHGWWDLYEDPPPTPFPASFDRINGIGEGTLAQPLYYGLGAAVLQVSRPANLESAYTHLRALSVLLGIVTVGIGWVGTRLLFGPEIAMGAAAIAALHPQFLLASISVNADALLNVWGGFVWWQAARVVTGHRRNLSIVLMLLGGVGGLLTKRIGLVMVGIAFGVSGWSLLRDRQWRVTWRQAFTMTTLGVVAASILLSAAFAFGGANIWGAFWMNALTIKRPLDEATFQEALRFLLMTVDYFWLIAGWLRFPPPEWWVWIARVLTVGGLAGAAVVLAESRAERVRFGTAWFFVAAQAAAMLYVVFWTIPSAPQARYLFPVFAPITALLYVGLKRAVPPTFHRRWPVALVLVLSAMDVTGFTTVHIPAYIR